MNRPLVCTLVFALIVVAGVSQARLVAERQDALPPGRHVRPAPARTVVVPPGETVVLTPVYPIHYPKPIYISPPLYGNYVPAYYQPAAYFEAVPITPVAETTTTTVTSTRPTRTIRTDPVLPFTSDRETFDK